MEQTICVNAPLVLAGVRATPANWAATRLQAELTQARLPCVPTGFPY